jgi:hypothetical protein
MGERRLEVLHEIDAPTRPPLLAACAAALKPGGWLVIAVTRR